MVAAPHTTATVERHRALYGGVHGAKRPCYVEAFPGGGSSRARLPVEVRSVYQIKGVGPVGNGRRHPLALACQKRFHPGIGEVSLQQGKAGIGTSAIDRRQHRLRIVHVRCQDNQVNQLDEAGADVLIEDMMSHMDEEVEP